MELLSDGLWNSIRITDIGSPRIDNKLYLESRVENLKIRKEERKLIKNKKRDKINKIKNAKRAIAQRSLEELNNRFQDLIQ